MPKMIDQSSKGKVFLSLENMQIDLKERITLQHQILRNP